MSLGDVRFADLPQVLWRKALVGILLGGMLAMVGFVPVAVLPALDDMIGDGGRAQECPVLPDRGFDLPKRVATTPD